MKVFTDFESVSQTAVRLPGHVKQSVQSLNGISKKCLQKFSVIIRKVASHPTVQNSAIPAFINTDTDTLTT